MATEKDRIKLYGFNNLTKTLSFNLYDLCYARSRDQQQQYIDYIDEEYNTERLTTIMNDVANIIGATILNVARQDYEPQGASVTMLIADEPLSSGVYAGTPKPGPLPDSLVGHLDKSHITVHTYPETHPYHGIATFRVDIDVSTCGLISPLKALNYLIHCFGSDVAIIDYRVRGFTRDEEGLKHFLDHDIASIQQYFSEDTKDKYQMVDVNVYQENLFHTKMMLKEFSLDNYLFDGSEADLSESGRREITKHLNQEMREIFYARNLPISTDIV